MTASVLINSRTEALLLDLDGTIADTLSVLWEAYTSFHLLTFGTPALRRDFDEFNGRPLKELMRCLVERHGSDLNPDQVTLAYQDFFRSKYLSSRPANGARKLILSARERGKKIVVVTSNKAEIARDWIQRNGFSGFIGGLVAGDDVKNGNPSAEPYLRALEIIGHPAELCMVVEDSVLGVQSALAAQIAVIGLSEDSDTFAEFADQPLFLGTVADLAELSLDEARRSALG